MTHLIEMARTRTHINEYPKSAPAVPISTISPAPSQVSTTTSPGPNDRRYPKKELGIASGLGVVSDTVGGHSGDGNSGSGTDWSRGKIGRGHREKGSEWRLALVEPGTSTGAIAAASDS